MILLLLSLVVAALGVFLMVLPPSRPAAGVLDVGRRAAEGGEHAADLVGRGHGLGVAVCESGAGDCEPGEGEHGEGNWFQYQLQGRPHHAITQRGNPQAAQFPALCCARIRTFALSWCFCARYDALRYSLIKPWTSCLRSIRAVTSTTWPGS